MQYSQIKDLLRRMYGDHTTAQTLVALRTTVRVLVSRIVAEKVKHAHPAFCDPHALRLENGESPRDLLLARLVNAAHDARVEHGRTERFQQKCAQVLRGDEGREELQRRDGV